MATILYGALAKPPSRLGVAERLKRELKHALHLRRDFRGLKTGQLATLDYRNYGRHQSTNIGDQAISDVIALTLATLRPELSLTPVNWGDYPALRQSLSASPGNDWLLVAGGGYVFLQTDGQLSDRLRRDLELCDKHQLKLALVGIGINQQTDTTNNVLISERDASTLRDLLQRSSVISVRDAFTQQVLQGYTDKDVLLAGDPALHLASKLAISTSDAPRDRTPRIGLNLPFHGPTSTALLRQNLQAYGAALHKLQAQTNCRYFYFQHYDTEAVIPSFLRQLGVTVTRVPNDIPTMLQAYADLDLHIGGMLHSCIFAHSVDTPCIGLAYDVKHHGFFDLFGLTEHCMSAFHFNPDVLLRTVRQILDDQTELRTKIRRTRQDLQTVSDRFFASMAVKLAPTLSTPDSKARP